MKLSEIATLDLKHAPHNFFKARRIGGTIAALVAHSTGYAGFTAKNADKKGERKNGKSQSKSSKTEGKRKEITGGTVVQGGNSEAAAVLK